jgi:penicillin-binding protein 2
MIDSPSETISVPSAPLNSRRILILSGIVLAGFVYVTLGLMYRQIFQASDLTRDAEYQTQRIVIRPPARGIIYDRNKQTLVDNRVRWRVKADLMVLQPEIRKEYLKLLAQAKQENFFDKPDYDKLLENARVNVLNRWLSKIWFVVDDNYQLNKTRTNKVYPLRDNPERRVNIDSLRKHLRESRAMKFTLISDLAFPGSTISKTPEEGDRAIARFIEQFPSGGPITLESDMVRSYPNGSLAAHVLGYVRDTDELPPNSEEFTDPILKRLQKLRYTGKKGAAGIEETMDYALRGTSGWELWNKTSTGYNKELVQSTSPVQGCEVVLTLNLNIQKAAEESLSNIRDSVGRPLPGAAVMIDVNNGEILAMASQPNFNPNRLADRVTNKYYDEIESTGGWLNRATQGLYAPGSTFKIITAIAGMRNHKVDWDDVLDCGAFYRVGNRNFPEHEPVGFGPVDVEKMLAISCNVWNYRVGLSVGPELLALEARRFGLDRPLLKNLNPSDTSKTYNYELPSTARGMVIPDPDYKARIGGGAWNQGDTANTSIGQGFLLTTPLHMACFAASLARGETITTPTLIPTGGAKVAHIGSQPIGLNRLQLEAIRSGMYRCVEEGTAKSVRIPGLPYVAKTGTAEYFKTGVKAHLAWIIGYAPADRPVVAFAVLVEGQLDTSTWGGKTAGPVAQEMLKAWADVR